MVTSNHPPTRTGPALVAGIAAWQWVLGLCVCLIPTMARANPVSVDGQSLMAFAIVAFWALVIESGILTLVLVPCGPLVIPLFGSLVIANVLVFLFAFLPLTGRASLWLLEPGVVVVDAIFIKTVAALPFVQFLHGS